MTFNEHCLIKSNISIPKKAINLNISYMLNPWLRNLNTDFTLNNCLFGSVKLTKNADLDKHKYDGYDVKYILVENFYLQMRAMEKISLFLVLI